MSPPMLFENLPVFPVPLPEDELRMLQWLPDWPTTAEVDVEDHGPARRLEQRRLIKIQRQKMDHIAVAPTWFAGKLPNVTVRLATDIT